MELKLKGIGNREGSQTRQEEYKTLHGNVRVRVRALMFVSAMFFRFFFHSFLMLLLSLPAALYVYTASHDGTPKFKFGLAVDDTTAI